MNRRDFLKNAITLAAFAPVVRLAAATGVDGNTKAGDVAAQVTRRRYKNTDQMLPLLGFGMMRLPRLNPDRPEIDYKVAARMVDMAMKSGCNYFDTAYMYHNGLSEKCTGELLSKYPRESFYLADKMPPWFAKKRSDLDRIFNEQLSRCKTGYFDFYLIHALSAPGWKHAEELKVYDFLRQKQAEGKIRRLGFSFHDTPEVLRQIVKAKPFDFVQLQINYYDWDNYRSREQYEIATESGLPVIVMEPLRGGSLATLNPEATAILDKAGPGAGNASWALRYVASLPNVITVLSGMSLPAHVKDNINTFAPFKPLSDAERVTLADALAAYRRKWEVPCTNCQYCLPCPVGVEIPKIFNIFNQYKVSGNAGQLLRGYNAIPAEARASECVRCGKCVKRCPQHISIPDELAKIAAEIKKLSAKK
ncbi:MAG: aldo/keto reductase [Victivallaceae bacterium]|nr:aldo/keto reductase [Victivallaceae bacterium]